MAALDEGSDPFAGLHKSRRRSLASSKINSNSLLAPNDVNLSKAAQKAVGLLPTNANYSSGIKQEAINAMSSYRSEPLTVLATAAHRSPPPSARCR